MADGLTIEELEIEVASDASGADAALSKLAATLGKLRSSVKGGAGLSTVTANLKSLDAAARNVDAGAASKIAALGKAVSSLAALDGLKLSSTVPARIRELGEASRSISGTDFSPISSAAAALTPLTALGKSNLSPFIRQLTELPSALQALDGADIF